MALTTISPALQDTQAQYTGFKNRIINGAMMIDQRNAGASVTVNSNSNFYAVDRFYSNGQATDGVFTAQRDSTAPSGFINSLKITVTTADSSIGSTQRYYIGQNIEGLNISDLGWGTSSAQTVTLSFWVRSSLTGTFGGSLRNEANDRSYPFSYTISAANTWEQKAITIVGDTTGTWLTTNGTGIFLTWAIGAGVDRKTTANSWASGNYFAPTGSVDLIGTNGATFYITGVQLEKGSTATSFDYRPYGTELVLCQRYYEKLYVDYTGFWNATNSFRVVVPMKVEKRATPTGTLANANWANDALNFSAAGIYSSYPTEVNISVDGSGTNVLTRYSHSVALSAEL